MKHHHIFIISAAIIIASSITQATAANTRNNDSENFSFSQNLDIYTQLLKELTTYYVDTIDLSKTVNNGINYMLNRLDPYTEYITEKESKDFYTHTTGEYGGIGSYIMQRDGGVFISEPYEGQPAQLAGVRAGDKIIMIDNDTVTSWSSSQVSERLKGQPNTPLKLTLLRPGTSNDTIVINLSRKKIQMNAVPYYGTVGDSIGYIYLNSFTDKAAEEVKEAFLDLKNNKHIKALILDLRGNTGGIMEAAIQIVNFFIPKGVEVLQTKGRIRQWDKTYKTTQEPIDTDIPLAILIDRNTASSSEIVSGALQDLDRAVIIGERSFGKGLVQQTRMLPYNGMLKVTIARYYIPSGRLIQAIDYSHRNPDGTVARIPDSLTNEFKTAHGRIVRDGGGIKPDIEPEVKKGSNLSYYLIRDFLIFDFATQYAAKHDTIASPETFFLTDSDYADFKEFVHKRDFKYDKQSNKILDSLREVAEFEGYLDDKTRQLCDSLAAQFNHDIEKDLDTFRPEIEELLTTEIVKRYYFQRGEMIVSQRNDSDIDAAIEVLDNQVRYKEILSPSQTEQK